MTNTQLQPPAATTDQPSILVEHLSISYRVRIDAAREGSLLDRIRRPPDRAVPALTDVSFEVPRGRTLAVIGRNGAGKSTLLRALSGVLAPNDGRITVRGRVSLLALGLGMNPNLTGRENIRLGGLAVGLSPGRLAELTEEIADFAQLGEYLDFPMKTYSSGMRQRLAFAVGANLDPDVLLIDEALGGGDRGFTEHAGEKMAELCGEGRTIVIVTHGMSSVRSMATDAIWLHQGRIAEAGDPDDIINAYMRYLRLEHLDQDDY